LSLSSLIGVVWDLQVLVRAYFALLRLLEFGGPHWEVLELGGVHFFNLELGGVDLEVLELGGIIFINLLLGGAHFGLLESFETFGAFNISFGALWSVH
jgi:hypothetical protein